MICLYYTAYILSQIFSEKHFKFVENFLCLFSDVCMVTNKTTPAIVNNILAIILYSFIDLIHYFLYHSMKEQYSRVIWGVQGHCYTVSASRSTVFLMCNLGRIETCQEKPDRKKKIYLINLTKTYVNIFSKQCIKFVFKIVIMV